MIISLSQDHGVGSSDYFHHYNFCITPNETPVNLDSWRSPAPKKVVGTGIWAKPKHLSPWLIYPTLY